MDVLIISAGIEGALPSPLAVSALYVFPDACMPLHGSFKYDFGHQVARCWRKQAQKHSQVWRDTESYQSPCTTRGFKTVLVVESPVSEALPILKLATLCGIRVATGGLCKRDVGLEVFNSCTALINVRKLGSALRGCLIYQLCGSCSCIAS